MSFLSRILVVGGLSVLVTLTLMVIHWEPEQSPPSATAETAVPQAVADPLHPAVERVIDLKTATTESAYGDERITWAMQDPQDIAELAGIRPALAGCLVPRSARFPNVISGEFKQAGQTDLAVLCVRGSQVSVVVFPGGATGTPDIAAESDFIPGTFILSVTAADISVEVRRELPIEPGMPLKIRHDGIQLGNGCCATTYYWHRERWRSYVSAD